MMNISRKINVPLDKKRKLGRPQVWILLRVPSLTNYGQDGVAPPRDFDPTWQVSAYMHVM